MVDPVELVVQVVLACIVADGAKVIVIALGALPANATDEGSGLTRVAQHVRMLDTCTRTMQQSAQGGH